MKKDITLSFGTETPSDSDRRKETRHQINLNVNYYNGDSYLYSKSENLSEMGIFLITKTPLTPGTITELNFDNHNDDSTLIISGEVVWIDPTTSTSPGGMGIRFINIDDETRARIRSIIRTMAYID
jgi:uncharacterized protein (TIGR02266 family)